MEGNSCWIEKENGTTANQEKENVELDQRPLVDTWLAAVAFCRLLFVANGDTTLFCYLVRHCDGLSEQ